MRIYNPSGYSYVKIVEFQQSEIQKIDMDLCAQPRQTLKSYYDSCAVKPTIICNGGFFNMSNGESVFTYADDGRILSFDPNNKIGMGILNNKLTYGDIEKNFFTDFVSAYPTLIIHGQKAKITVAQELNYKARRTVLAYNKDKIYLLAVEKPGMNFSELQNLLLTLKVDYAINLDGGGSTKILYNGSSITKDWGNRSVDNVIAFYLKPQTLYRVQLGAFSRKENANNLLKQIQSLSSSIGIDYKKAYVRKVGCYYKVQVGAFSRKENANRVVNELKGKGYNSFVTAQ